MKVGMRQAGPMSPISLPMSWVSCSRFLPGGAWHCRSRHRGRDASAVPARSLGPVRAQKREEAPVSVELLPVPALIQQRLIWPVVA